MGPERRAPVARVSHELQNVLEPRAGTSAGAGSLSHDLAHLQRRGLIGTLVASIHGLQNGRSRMGRNRGSFAGCPSPPLASRGRLAWRYLFKVAMRKTNQAVDGSGAQGLSVFEQHRKSSTFVLLPPPQIMRPPQPPPAAKRRARLLWQDVRTAN